MKNLVCSFIFSFLAVAVFAQSGSWTVVEAASVPEAVKAKQSAQFPGTTVAKWEKKSGQNKKGVSFTHYVAVFKVDGNHTRARFKEDGTLNTATTHLPAPKLPQAIQTMAATKYAEYKLTGGEKIMDFSTNKETYRIKLLKGSAKLTVYVDANGNEVQKDKVSENVKDSDTEGPK
ncbi:MAG: hypothetical protein SFW35_07450 [Chitinophagales bacterium]|nr:hypothetical protein [Chitinophagales bacterium]